MSAGAIGSARWLARDWAGRIARDLTAGLIVGGLMVIHSISLASMVMTGPLAAFRGPAIALMLFTTIVTGLVVSLLGSLRGGAANVQDTPMAVFAVMAVGVVATLPAGAGPAVAFATVVACMAVTTLATGAVLLLVGGFRLGSLVRYLPFPVVGGLAAGTGWLLVVAAVAASLGVTIDTLGPATLVAAESFYRWAPGVAFGILLLVLTQVVRHPLTFPAALALAVTGFHLLLAVEGSGSDAWRSAGLLLGPFGEEATLRLLAVDDLTPVHWGALPGQAFAGATVVLLTLLGVLFNATGVEHALGVRLDLDRQLRASGIGNLMSGSLGGSVGYQGVGFTLLNHGVGTGSRTSMLIAVAVVASALVGGTGLVLMVPTFVVGGLLTYLGASVLTRSLLSGYRELPRLEYALMVVIVAVVATVGYFEGVAVGLVLAVVLFVVSYARIDPVRHARSGAGTQSRVRWDGAERRLLAAAHGSMLVLELQGYLFFASMHHVTRRVERRLEERPPLTRLVLDFRRVAGLDATAAAAVVALARSARQHGVTLLLTALPEPGGASLLRALERASAAEGVRAFASLADALEWCERSAIAALVGDHDQVAVVLERLERLAGDDLELMDLLGHLERVEVAAGARLVDVGRVPEALFIVAAGQFGTRLPGETGAEERDETVRPGGLLAAIGFYTRTPSPVTVVADEPATVYRLDHAGLEAVTARDPALAAALHAAVARQLAESLDHLRQVAAALER